MSYLVPVLCRPAYLAALLLIASCSSEDAHDDDDHSEEDPAEHACEQAEQAGTPLAAAQSPDEAPKLDVSELPYTVSLPESEPGYLSIAGPLEGLLMASTENVVESLTLEGSSENLLVQAAPNAFCAAEIPEHWDLELDAGQYVLQVGPAAVNEVQLFLVEAAGHGHDDE